MIHPQNTAKDVNNAMYKVIFHNHQRSYKLFAEKVSSSELFGFIEISGLQFGPEKHLLVNLDEEKLRAEFADSESCLIPQHAILRIDRVKDRGEAKVRDFKNSDRVVTPFPLHRQDLPVKD